MPGFLFPGRPGGENDEPLLDMIFDGRSLPPRAPQEIHDLARMLAVAVGPAEEPSELAGEAAALAAFTRSASPASVLSPARTLTRHRRPRRHRARRRWSRSRAKLAAALFALIAALSGAAAYTGVLQQVAHVTVKALAVSSGVHKSPPPRSASQPRHSTKPVAQQAPTPGTGHAHDKQKAGGTTPALPLPGHRNRTPGCSPWPYQSPRPWNSPPNPAPTGPPQLTRCPGTPTPVPTPTKPIPGVPTAPSTGLATRSNSAIPESSPTPSINSSPTPGPVASTATRAPREQEVIVHRS